MGILDFWRSKDVRAVLAALDVERRAAGSLFLSLGFELASPTVMAAIRNAPGKVEAKLREEHMAPRTLVYLMLVNQCGSLIQSGVYHNAIGGGLLMQGTGLVALWQLAATELERAGVWGAEEASEYREVFRKQRGA